MGSRRNEIEREIQLYDKVILESFCIALRDSSRTHGSRDLLVSEAKELLESIVDDPEKQFITMTLEVLGVAKKGQYFFQCNDEEEKRIGQIMLKASEMIEPRGAGDGAPGQGS